jgi:membrane associated rhomboid family serine protease
MLRLAKSSVERSDPAWRLSARAHLTQALRERTRHIHATYTLLAINVLVFLLLAADAGSTRFSARYLIGWGAAFGPATTKGEWWRFLTATFLHAHLLHLVFNMLAFILIAPTLERLLGTRAFVLVYIACGLTGSAVSLWSNPHIVGVGASGSIMGIYGMLIALMIERGTSGGRQNQPLAEHGLIRRNKLGVHLQPAIGAVVSTLWFGWLLPNVDNAAHLGGLACGCLIGWFAGRDIERTTPRWHDVAAAVAIGISSCGVALGATGRMNDLRPALMKAFEVDSRTRLEYSKARTANADSASLYKLIDADIVPAFAKERTALQAFGTVPAAQASVLEDLRRFVALREEAWTHRARWYRDQHNPDLRRSEEIDESAALVVRRLLSANLP